MFAFEDEVNPRAADNMDEEAINDAPFSSLTLTPSRSEARRGESNGKLKRDENELPGALLLLDFFEDVGVDVFVVGVDVFDGPNTSRCPKEEVSAAFKELFTPVMPRFEDERFGLCANIFCNLARSASTSIC